ncbi:MAG: PEP-CTERM sorting domain-containing protein [Planctomycetes bacterium]|nr:PEP-CTERM sorting domain-containing protein [Planctomycetota bacterium]
MRLPVWGLLITVLSSFVPMQKANADWDLRIQFPNDGWGRVTTSLSGNYVSNTAGTFYDVTVPQPPNSSLVLTAHERNLQILSGVNDSALQFGNDFSYNLSLQLGSKFDQWSGEAVNTFPILDLQQKTIAINQPLFTPIDGIYEVNANYTSGFQNVKFTFNGNPLNSITKNTTSGTLSWSEISSFVTLGNNTVSVLVTDETGSVNDSFDLDVFSPSGVPEPSSLLLVGAFGAGYIGWRRRRR